jgi:hypothetical protein
VNKTMRIILVTLLLLMLSAFFTYKRVYCIDLMTGDSKNVYSFLGIFSYSEISERSLIQTFTDNRKWEVITEKTIWSKKEFRKNGQLNSTWSELILLNKMMTDHFPEDSKKKGVRYLQDGDLPSMKNLVDELMLLEFTNAPVTQ